MTKKVRVENADTSTHKVKVFAEYRNSEGVWKKQEMETEHILASPCALLETHIHATRRLIIEEVVEQGN